MSHNTLLERIRAEYPLEIPGLRGLTREQMHRLDGIERLLVERVLDDLKAVLYVDMLGFSALTENYPAGKADFAVVDRANREDFLERWELTGNNRLIDHYTKFNMAVDDVVEGQMLRKVGEIGEQNNLTVISFSDSAFIAVDSVYTAISIGKSILTRLLRDRIPVRCAIAYGSFVVLRFRSDLSLRAETHAARFAGTGVVWSHNAAELSGIKGMRIFLHSSADRALLQQVEYAMLQEPEHAALVPDGGHLILPLPSEECQNPAGVKLEVSHLNSGLKNWDAELWDDIRAMKREAPRTVQAHYVATLESINRMRQALGREPFVTSSFTGSAQISSTLMSG